MSVGLIAAVAGLALAGLIGWLLTRRSGVLREAGTGPDQSVGVAAGELGLAEAGPTVVHFSAPWCGPCVQVRRLVDKVCADLGDVAHVEIDIDTSSAAARKLSVLMLPTVFIFDAHGRQRYRATGVPAAADLRSALEPLLG